MAFFVVRVVLKGPPPRETYLELHEALARNGIRDVIQDTGGQWFRLPDAEYFARGDISAADLRVRVSQIASGVWSNAQVLVTEAANVSWIGLEPVAAPF